MFSSFTSIGDEYRFVNLGLHKLDDIDENIKVVDLRNNKFQQIPPSLQFLKLTHLLLADNIIKELYLYKFDNLKQLDLSNNLIVLMPDSFMYLSNLQSLNLNYNLIKILSTSIADLSLKFLGIACNCFTYIPNQYAKLIDNLLTFELDWLKYVNISYSLNPQSREILRKIFINGSSFRGFQYFIQKMDTQFKIDQLVSNHSRGIITQYYHENYLDNQIQPLIYGLNNANNKEGDKTLACIIDLQQQNSEVLNIFLLFAVKQMHYNATQFCIKKGINPQYILAYDIIVNNKIQFHKDTSAIQILLNQIENQKCQQIAKLLIKIGFKPDQKVHGYNSLHASVKQSLYHGAAWAIQYCKVDSKDGKYKNTSLHYAFNSYSLDIFYLLAQYKANPFIQNRFNKSPRYFQWSIVYIRVIKEFIKYEKWFLYQLFEKKQNGINQNFFDQQHYEEDQSLRELSRIIRQNQYLKNILVFMETLNTNQLKLLTILMLQLILLRQRFAWTYQTTQQSSIIKLINDMPINTKAYITQNSYKHNQLLILKNKKNVENSSNNAKNFKQSLSHLSLKIQKDISNTYDNQPLQQIQDYQLVDQLKYQSFNQFCKFQNPDTNNNLTILLQYEQLQKYDIQKKLTKLPSLIILESPRTNLSQHMLGRYQLQGKFKEADEYTQRLDVHPSTSTKFKRSLSQLEIDF